MKKLYTSPVVTVEELTKIDVLCASSEAADDTNYDPNKLNDNLNQSAGSIGDMTRFL